VTVALDPRLHVVARAQPYPLLFVTVSGAHLYGFPSPDFDYDLRGVHVLPVRDVVGLDTGRETIEVSSSHEGLELDLVTHDARKFFGLLLRRNGYVLEQLTSPLVVHTTAEHVELLTIAPGCVTRHHAHPWRLFEKEQPRRVKPLLYVYRVLLTGIHLMRTGSIEANLIRLNGDVHLSYIDELVARKVAGPERALVPEAGLEFHRGEYPRLLGELEAARDQSHLPEAPTARAALNDLLVRIRMQSIMHAPA